MTDPVRIPGLLDVSIEPPFIRSRQVADLAAEVIASFDEFEPIQTAQRECGLAVEYVFETRPFDPARDEFHPHVIAKVTKASPLWLSLADTHIVVQFRRWFWERFDDAQRRAVLHHELMHVHVDEPDEQGRLPIRLRKHEVEDFNLTMRRFGPVIPGRKAFIAAAAEWSREHPEALPEHADAFGHQVAEAVAARINAGEMGPGVTATVTHSPRVVDPETGEILDTDDPEWVRTHQDALDAHNKRAARDASRARREAERAAEGKGKPDAA